MLGRLLNSGRERFGDAREALAAPDAARVRPSEADLGASNAPREAEGTWNRGRVCQERGGPAPLNPEPRSRDLRFRMRSLCKPIHMAI